MIEYSTLDLRLKFLENEIKDIKKTIRELEEENDIQNKIIESNKKDIKNIFEKIDYTVTEFKKLKWFLVANVLLLLFDLIRYVRM